MRGAFPTGTEPGAGHRPRWTPPDPETLKPHFPQLEILELIGAGGMGAVYRAVQKKLGRVVALKILPLETAKDPAFAERFAREAKALALLNHPNIVAVYDFGQSGEYYFFIMEFVEGANLRQLIRDKSLEPRQALELVIQICTALQFAHDEKIIHRDIKPENILISKKGQVKIADFGLAKLMGPAPDTSLTASQMVMGTLNYMAPEQRENAKDVDHRADIYSVGVVFYEMLTGQVPMGRFDPPSKKVQVDVRLDEVVLHAMEREPERRYQQVSEVKSKVEAISSNLPKEPAAGRAPETFKSGLAPGFAAFVLKRFAIFALVWIVITLGLRLTMGENTISTNANNSFFTQFGVAILALALAPFSLVAGKFVLPAIFAMLFWMWLEAREKRGLKLRQFSPRCRRRHLFWSAVSAAVYLAAVMGTIAVIEATGILQRPINHDFRAQSEQATEWWFAPHANNFEKLGFRLNYSKEGNRGGLNGELPACTVSLSVHQTNQPPATMTVVLPGLRSKYRIPLTNTWDTEVVLDRDALIEWLHKGAGLDPAAPKFKEQADEIYSLLKTYENLPPETVKEFVNLAKADLKEFWFSGSQMDGFTYMAGLGFPIFWIPIVIVSLIYAMAAYWIMRRIYREGWAEIEAGRWTPPLRREKESVLD